MSDLKDEKFKQKREKTNSVLESFEYFCQNFIKIDHHNSELHRFEVGAFFETQCNRIIPYARNSNIH